MPSRSPSIALLDRDYISLSLQEQNAYLTHIISGLIESPSLDMNVEARDLLNHFSDFHFNAKEGVDPSEFNPLIASGNNGELDVTALNTVMDRVSVDGFLHLYYFLRKAASIPSVQQCLSPVQVLADAMASAIVQANDKLSGNQTRVRINLSAHTRIAYSEEIIIPVEFDDSNLNDLIDQAYRDLNACVFYDDPDYRVKGDCFYEVLIWNTNCLAGMRCPNCQSLGPLILAVNGSDIAGGMGQLESHNTASHGEVSRTRYIAKLLDDGKEDGSI